MRSVLRGLYFIFCAVCPVRTRCSPVYSVVPDFQITSLSSRPLYKISALRALTLCSLCALSCSVPLTLRYCAPWIFCAVSSALSTRCYTCVLVSPLSHFSSRHGLHTQYTHQQIAYTSSSRKATTNAHEQRTCTNDKAKPRPWLFHVTTHRVIEECVDAKANDI